MKNLKETILEKLVFNKHTKAKNHNYFNTCDELVRHVNDLYYIKLSDKVQNDIIENIKSHLKDKLDINKYIFVRSRKIIRDQFAIDLITDSGEAYLSHKEFYQERAIYFDDDISVFYESVMLTKQTGIVKFLIFVNYKNSCIHHYCLIDKKDINKYNLNENLQQLDEKLVFNKHTKSKYNYHPKTKDELKELINKLIKERGDNADLNDIDTSQITDMSELFYQSSFNGDISNWDVSNVKNMSYMFARSEFTCENGDISNWDVSNVKNMLYMFALSEFTGENVDISKWDVSNVLDMRDLFYNSKFNGDISNWDVSKVAKIKDMFDKSPLEKNPPKWYKE